VGPALQALADQAAEEEVDLDVQREGVSHFFGGGGVAVMFDFGATFRRASSSVIAWVARR
jgi:hypothetical protein